MAVAQEMLVTTAKAVVTIMFKAAAAAGAQLAAGVLVQVVQVEQP